MSANSFRRVSDVEFMLYLIHPQYEKALFRIPKRDNEVITRSEASRRRLRADQVEVCPQPVIEQLQAPVAVEPIPAIEQATATVTTTAVEAADPKPPNKVTDPLPQVPDVFKTFPNWVTWGNGRNEKGEIVPKIPTISGTNKNAKASEPSTWVPYQTACENIAAGKGSDRLGFEITPETGIVGADLDGCIGNAYDIADWAESIIELVGETYIERTPSGTGLHVWIRGLLPQGKSHAFLLNPATAGSGNSKVQIEVYDSGRYFTMTGKPEMSSYKKVAVLDDAKMAALFELFELIEKQYPLPPDKQAHKQEKKVPRLRARDGSFVMEPVPPDEGFKRLFEQVGWEPFVDRVRESTDTRFADFDLTSGRNNFCPMPSHPNRGAEVPYTAKYFGSFSPDDGVELVHCLNCGYSGDMVKAFSDFANGEEGGKAGFQTMYQAARYICEEYGLKFEEFFPPQTPAPTPQPTNPVVTLRANEPPTPRLETPKTKLTDIPFECLGKRLGHIYEKIFAPAPLCVPVHAALPALVTAASVFARSADSYGIDSSNIYTVYIAPPGDGKSVICDWAAMSVGIYREPSALPYIGASIRSEAQLAEAYKDAKAKLPHWEGDNVLLNVDEYADIAKSINREGSQFGEFLTSGYYKKKELRYTDRGKRQFMTFDHRFSLLGGIPEDNFGEHFGIATMGGLYTRFYLESLDGWKIEDGDFRPFPIEKKSNDPYFDFEPMLLPKVNPGAMEVLKGWNIKGAANKRIGENIIRMGRIIGALDKTAVIGGRELEVFEPVARRLVETRELFKPNPGEGVPAVVANEIAEWLKRHEKSALSGGWFLRSLLYNGLKRTIEKHGPYWVDMATRNDFRFEYSKEPPSDAGWTGQRNPKQGFVRLRNDE